MNRLFVTLLCATSLFAADFDPVDKAAFARLFPSNAKVERIATDMRFLEGPAWVSANGGFLIFSDIPADELKRWDPKSGVKTFRQPSGNANGNTIDAGGLLVTAEHGNRRISRTLKSGEVVTLVDTFEGKKLNSPNDVVVKSDGTIWFTDPDYGLAGRPKEQQGNYVYRYDPATKTLTPISKDFDKPNGLCFSPDESKLYVADSGKPRHIRVFTVSRNNEVSGGEVFAAIDKGGPDGIRADAQGNVWSSSGDGAQVFSPEGRLITRILLPESAANLTFGGRNGKRLFLTARKSLYVVDTNTKMALRPKRRK